MTFFVGDIKAKQTELFEKHKTQCSTEKNGNICCNKKCDFAHKMKFPGKTICDTVNCRNQCKKHHLFRFSYLPWNEECDNEKSGHICKEEHCNKLHIYVHKYVHYCLNGLNCTDSSCYFRHIVKNPKKSADCDCKSENKYGFGDKKLCYCVRIYNRLSDWSEIAYEEDL